MSLFALYLFITAATAVTSPCTTCQSLAARQLPPPRTAKAGLAWPNGPFYDTEQFRSTGKAQWYYTWSPSPINTDLEFVPMLWGFPQVSQWSHTINDLIRQRRVTHVLGFNEPQQKDQSNMSPADAAAIWKEHVEPLKAQGIFLGSPAPSSAPNGKQWLFDWMGNCGSWGPGGCTVDFVALHWYGVNSTAFIEYLVDFHDAFQRPIWVTEWACQNFNQLDQQCSQQDIVDFMAVTESFMDQTDWVERYAWFGAMRHLSGVNQWNALMNASGYITTLGQQYIGAIAPTVSPDFIPGIVHGGFGAAPFADSSAGRLEGGILAVALVGLYLWMGA